MGAILYAARLPGEPCKWRAGVSPVCEGPHDYWRGLAGPWDLSDTIVNLEHDMEYSPRLVDELLECPHPLCTHAYQMHHHGPSHYAQSLRGDGLNGAWYGTGAGMYGGPWINDGVEWAEYSGIGFCKIAADARIGSLARDVWFGVEMSVNNAVRGPWHVHWQHGPDGEPLPIEHYHPADR